MFYKPECLRFTELFTLCCDLCRFQQPGVDTQTEVVSEQLERSPMNTAEFDNRVHQILQAITSHGHLSTFTRALKETSYQ